MKVLFLLTFFLFSFKAVRTDFDDYDVQHDSFYDDLSSFQSSDYEYHEAYEGMVSTVGLSLPIKVENKDGVRLPDGTEGILVKSDTSPTRNIDVVESTLSSVKPGEVILPVAGFQPKIDDVKEIQNDSAQQSFQASSVDGDGHQKIDAKDDLKKSNEELLKNKTSGTDLVGTENKNKTIAQNINKSSLESKVVILMEREQQSEKRFKEADDAVNDGFGNKSSGSAVQIQKSVVRDPEIRIESSLVTAEEYSITGTKNAPDDSSSKANTKPQNRNTDSMPSMVEIISAALAKVVAQTKKIKPVKVESAEERVRQNDRTGLLTEDIGLSSKSDDTVIEDKIVAKPVDRNLPTDGTEFSAKHDVAITRPDYVAIIGTSTTENKFKSDGGLVVEGQKSGTHVLTAAEGERGKTTSNQELLGAAGLTPSKNDQSTEISLITDDDAMKKSNQATLESVGLDTKSVESQLKKVEIGVSIRPNDAADKTSISALNVETEIENRSSVSAAPSMVEKIAAALAKAVSRSSSASEGKSEIESVTRNQSTEIAFLGDEQNHEKKSNEETVAPAAVVSLKSIEEDQQTGQKLLDGKDAMTSSPFTGFQSDDDLRGDLQQTGIKHSADEDDEKKKNDDTAADNTSSLAINNFEKKTESKSSGISLPSMIEIITAAVSKVVAEVKATEDADARQAKAEEEDSKASISRSILFPSLQNETFVNNEKINSAAAAASSYWSDPAIAQAAAACQAAVSAAKNSWKSQIVVLDACIGASNEFRYKCALQVVNVIKTALNETLMSMKASQRARWSQMTHAAAFSHRQNISEKAAAKSAMIAQNIFVEAATRAVRASTEALDVMRSSSQVRPKHLSAAITAQSQAETALSSAYLSRKAVYKQIIAAAVAASPSTKLVDLEHQLALEHQWEFSK